MACLKDALQAASERSDKYKVGPRVARNFDQASSCVGHQLVHTQIRIPRRQKQTKYGRTDSRQT